MFENFILLLPVNIGILCALYFFFAQANNKFTERLPAINLLLLSASAFCYVKFYDFDFDNYYIYDIIQAFSVLTLYPVLYIYMYKISNINKLSAYSYLLFLPSVFIGLSTTVIYILLGDDKVVFIKDQIFRHDIPAPDYFLYKLQIYIAIYAFLAILFIQSIFITVMIRRNILIQLKRLADYYSEEQNEYQKYFYNTLYSICALSVSSVYICFVRRGTSDTIFIYLYLIALSCIVLFLAYNASMLNYYSKGYIKVLSDTYENESKEEELTENEKKTESKGKTAIDNLLIKDFKRLFIDEKIYLRPSVKLDDIARELKTNRTYVSRIINDEYLTSFSTLINDYRIRHALNLFDARPELNIDEVSEMSGFSNSTSFYRAFKSHTGTTPANWQKNNCIKSA